MANGFITADEENIWQFKFWFIGWCVSAFLVLGAYIYLRFGDSDPYWQELMLMILVITGVVFLILTIKSLKLFHAFRTRKILEKDGEEIPVIVEWIKWENITSVLAPGYWVQVSYIYEGKVKVWTSQRYNVDPKRFLSFSSKASNCKLLVKGHRKMLDRRVYAHYVQGFERDYYYNNQKRSMWILTKTNRVCYSTGLFFLLLVMIAGGKAVIPKGYFTLADKWCLCAFCMFCGAGILFLAFVVWCIKSIKKEQEIAEQHWK
ncbi:MAG: hypothetical protein J5372_09595 [Lachnospiraceae bacterium]|nr:hypothetical protein [Lachnospiraceae bacterium]